MKKYFKYNVMDQTHLQNGDTKTRSFTLFRWVVVVPLLMLFFSIASANVQPKLTEYQAIRIVDDAFKMQPLFWQGFTIPYRIERGSKHNDAAMLEVLFNHQLLKREKEIQLVKIEGSNRKRIALNYRYSFADKNVGARLNSQGGFYYGYGRLKKVLQLSKPYFVGGFYYAEAYVQWYVTDIQDWVDAPAFDKARTLRRSLESKSKPFEKRVYLQYNGQGWAFWKGKPGGL
ncbi:MAG: hypothetical protein ACI910_002915 [Oleispira sp.]|jgi:hypothetical protein